MDRIQLLDDIERYLRNEMTPGEKYAFEELRQNDPDVDLMVVEHSLFMHQLEQFGDQKNFRSALHEIHTELRAHTTSNGPHHLRKIFETMDSPPLFIHKKS